MWGTTNNVLLDKNILCKVFRYHIPVWGKEATGLVGEEYGIWKSVEDIAQYFDWVNLMYGMKGQTFEQLQEDILLAEQHFSRVNLSIYTTIPNGIERDDQAISQFYRSDLYQQLLTNPKFEIYDEWDKENYHNVGHDK